MSEKPFKVIIVGGGPVGLSAAHVLNALKIDFIVLEKRDTTIQDPGASNFINPFSCKIYEQLGIYKDFEKYGCPTPKKVNCLVDGSASTKGSLDFVEALGYPLLGFDRRVLLRILTESLPERDQRIKTKAKVVDIKILDNGVEAILEDGTVIPGSIVLGTDGTWSRTRTMVQKLATEASTKPLKHQENINSKMQTLYGRGTVESIPGVESGTFFDTHSPGQATQAGVRNGTDFWFLLYKHLETPSTTHTVYTQEQTDAYVAEFADVKLLGLDGPALKDLWKHVEWCKLVDQEDGFSAHMHHKRIVLAGDSAVKLTSIAGLGLNYGVQAVVNLGNALRDVLDKDPNPSTETLEKAFELYEEQTIPLATFSTHISKESAKIAMWHNWIYKFIDQWVLPYFPPMKMDRMIEAQFHKQMPPHCRLINGLDTSNVKKGTVF